MYWINISAGGLSYSTKLRKEGIGEIHLSIERKSQVESC
jgi:hypothetical protein